MTFDLDLYMLRGTILRHNIQYNDAEEDIIPHGEPNHSVCRHLIPDRPSFLFAQ